MTEAEHSATCNRTESTFDDTCPRCMYGQGWERGYYDCHRSDRSHRATEARLALALKVATHYRKTLLARTDMDTPDLNRGLGMGSFALRQVIAALNGQADGADAERVRKIAEGRDD